MARSSAGSPPSPVIFDSDVLIHYLRGRPSAAEFIRKVPFLYRKLSAIAGQALRLMERHALPHGLRVADALIAATALVRGFELTAANERHYRP